MAHLSFRSSIRPSRLELEVTHLDGSTRWTETTLSLLRDDTGPAVGLVGVTRDITDRRRIEASLRQTEKLAALGQLLAGVAHELNNPLSVVLGRAQLLAAGAEGRVATHAEHLVRAADRCARIVRSFLTLAREHPIRRRAVSLNEIVTEAVQLVAYGLRVDDVDVVLDLACDRPAVYGDPDQLHQVVVNLVTNAHHALREISGPRRLTLASRADRRSGMATLRVTDTGPGIRPDAQAHLFEPFFTTKPPGQGTGLGLSVCRGIVEAHEGVIRVERPSGTGATFVVELPLARADVHGGNGHEGRIGPPPTPGAILVTDDERDVAELVADVLRLEGHVVDIAHDGAAALDRLRTTSYDVVVADLRRPVLDGPGLYEGACELRPELTDRFLFVTGDDLHPHAREFLRCVGAPTIRKPFPPDARRGLIGAMLRRHHGAAGRSPGPAGHP